MVLGRAPLPAFAATAPAVAASAMPSAPAPSTPTVSGHGLAVVAAQEATREEPGMGSRPPSC